MCFSQELGKSDWCLAYALHGQGNYWMALAYSTRRTKQVITNQKQVPEALNNEILTSISNSTFPVVMLKTQMWPSRRPPSSSVRLAVLGRGDAGGRPCGSMRGRPRTAARRERQLSRLSSLDDPSSSLPAAHHTASCTTSLCPAASRTSYRHHSNCHNTKRKI